MAIKVQETSRVVAENAVKVILSQREWSKDGKEDEKVQILDMSTTTVSARGNVYTNKFLSKGASNWALLFQNDEEGDFVLNSVLQFLHDQLDAKEWENIHKRVMEWIAKYTKNAGPD